jgi:hypothetical protein
MNDLVRCFQENKGRRGVTFFDSQGCTFLPWQEVFKFLDNLPSNYIEHPFSEKLADMLANYDPEDEFLAVRQEGNSVAVELYSRYSNAGP